MDAKTINVRNVPGLDENGLPNTAGGGVPAPLFSHRLLGVIHRVLNAQDQLTGTCAIGLRFERISKIKLERSVTALVVTEMFTIAPAVGEEICCPDGEDDALIFPDGSIWNTDLATIPAHLVTRHAAVIFLVTSSGLR